MKSDLTRWTVNDLMKLFNYSGTRQSLLKAEKEGRIPKAERLNTTVKTRAWPVSALPIIGSQYGFLKPPKSQVRICIYTAKGGVLKTTITYTLGRLLALHGIKTVIVGLDSQGSITALALNPLATVESIEDLPEYRNVGELIFSSNGKEIDPKDVIEPTTLPTLDVIPETESLTDVDNRMGAETAVGAIQKKPDAKNRYTYFTKKLLPSLKDYDVVLFDNSPSWSFLIENSLYASDYVISPTACDPGSYQVLENNLNAILDFQSSSDKKWRKLFLVPTLKDNSRLSSQIHAAYMTTYSKFVTNTFIRKTVKGAEAFSYGTSPIEFDVKSDLAEDYFDLTKEIWHEILKGER